MSSCEDMLEVDSDRVEYDMSPLTFSDSVYSVLGILKNVQAVADRQVLLGELRGDLMVVNEGSAITDIQKISRFDFTGENKYLSVKDYYAIINNCNIYLARVDTALTRDNKMPMLKEYVGVKSVRAWTYLQLVTNYGKVPYFTEPILTHSLSQEIATRPLLGIEEIADKLIEDLRPYANPAQYPMPNFPGLTPLTELHFMPIRQLLGDLYLWKKDYRNAIDCYYNLIKDNKYIVNGSINGSAFWMSADDPATYPSGDYMPLLSFNQQNTLALVSFASSANYGEVSDLHNVILGDISVRGSHQVAAAPGLYGLSGRQVYHFAKEGENASDNGKAYVTTNPNREKPGDVRLYTIVEDNILNYETGAKYNGLITKFSGSMYMSSSLTAVKLGRPVQVYLRLAEALAGLASEQALDITLGDGESGEVIKSGWENAENIAMYILKYGLGRKYSTTNTTTDKYYKLPVPSEQQSGIYEIKRRINDVPDTVQVVKKDPATGEIVYKYNEDGTPVYIVGEDGEYLTDADGNYVQMPDSVEEIRFNEDYDKIVLDFNYDADFQNNQGIHGFGSGDTEWDDAYSFNNDSIIAAYFDKVADREVMYQKDENGENVLGEDGQPIIIGYDYKITKADKIAYIRNLILDECALETAFEGYRFTDLIRFAKAMGDNDVLAKRVAARAFENKVNMYYQTEGVMGNDGSILEYKMDDNLYNILSKDESNWYLPLK